jgi:hypothetical protein
MWKRLFGRRKDESTAAKQEGDVHALDRPDDPRGGVQTDDYRHARPDEVLEEGDTVMGGPGGSPGSERSPDERRDDDRGG